MLARVLVAIPCLLIAWSAVVNADVLVLRDGRRLNGILSNSAVVRDDPGAFGEISFLVGTGPQAVLRRFATVEIEWILIEEGTNPSVIDFAHLSMRSPGVSNAVERPPNRKVTTYVELEGGFTWGRFHGDDADDLRDYRNGRTFGARLTSFKGDYFGMSLGARYIEKGASGKQVSYTGQETRMEFSMNYIEIPALIVGRLRMDKHAVRAFAGPTLAFLMSAKTYGTGWSSVGAPSLDGEHDITNDISDLDFGWRAGLGLELALTRSTSLLIEGSYARSITGFAEEPGVDWTHGVITAEIGLSFALNRDNEDQDRRESTRPRWGKR